MTPQDRLTSRAQVGITVMFVLGYFALLFVLILGWSKMQKEIAELVSTLVSVLTAVVVQICSYWFARHRHQQESRNVESETDPDSGGSLASGRAGKRERGLLERQGFRTPTVGEESPRGSVEKDQELRGRTDGLQRPNDSGLKPGHEAVTGSAVSTLGT